MQTRLIGTTGPDLPVLSFGTTSPGVGFRTITSAEAIRSRRTSFDRDPNGVAPATIESANDSGRRAGPAENI